MTNFSDLLLAKVFDVFCCCIKGWSSMALTGFFIPAGVSTSLFLTLRSNLIVFLWYLTASTNDLH